MYDIEKALNRVGITIKFKDNVCKFLVAETCAHYRHKSSLMMMSNVSYPAYVEKVTIDIGVFTFGAYSRPRVYVVVSF